MIVTATINGVKPFPVSASSGRIRIICGVGCTFCPSSDQAKRFEITSDTVELTVDKSAFTLFGFDRNIIVEEV